MRDPPEQGPGERFVTGLGRFIVSLMWGALLAVVVLVFWLVQRFYG